MQKGDTGTVLLLLFVLAFAVVIVDERLLRVLIAVVPALLLAQRALGGEKPAPKPVGHSDRRMDSATRSSVDELHLHIREFYLTCHLFGVGKMDPDEATEKVAQQEQKLNQLLAKVTDVARTNIESPS